MAGHRIERLQSLFTHEISKILRDEIKDPRVDGIYSITHIKLSKDLKSALIFMSVLEEGHKKEEVLQGLNSSSKYIQKRLWKNLSIKQIPHLKFKLDESIEKGVNLYYKLKKMEQEEAEQGWHNHENGNTSNG